MHSGITQCYMILDDISMLFQVSVQLYLQVCIMHLNIYKCMASDITIFCKQPSRNNTLWHAVSLMTHLRIVIFAHVGH